MPSYNALNAQNYQIYKTYKFYESSMHLLKIDLLTLQIKFKKLKIIYKINPLIL